VSKFIARPVEVDSHKIMEAGAPLADGDQALVLENGITVTATSEMTCRMKPQPGDFWVISEDGHISILPKRVHEKRYRPE
jgi:hypothetical protein